MRAGVADRKKGEDLDLQGGQVIDDRKLYNTLRRRQDLRDQIKEISGKFEELDEEAKARIRELSINGKARCGKFLISTEERPGRTVAFETKPSRRIRIVPIPEE